MYVKHYVALEPEMKEKKKKEKKQNFHMLLMLQTLKY